VAETLPDVKDKVSVLMVSDPIPNDNVSAVSGLSEATRQKVQEGLLAIAQTEEGKAALQTLYGIEVLQPVEDSFYDDFRATLAAAGVSPQDYVK
jgi:phosphonate transport system substrate-binding protein